MARPQGGHFARICFCVSLATSTIFAEASLFQGVSKEPRFERFNVKDGLSHPTVEALSQDPNGYLWIATQDGLNLFDGDSVHPMPTSFYKIVDPWIYDISTPLESKAILTTRRGIYHYDAVKAESEKLLIQSDVNHPSACVEHFENHFYVCTRDGIIVWDKSKPYSSAYTIQTPEQTPIALHQHTDRTIWVGTTEGLFKLTNGQLQRTSIPTLANARITSILSNDLGIWVGTSDSGLQFIDSQNQSSSTEKLKGLEIRVLETDSQGNLWVGTNRGLYIFSEDGPEVVARHDTTNPLSLSSDIVNSITVDTGQNVWVGTVNGLNKFSPNYSQFRLFNRQNTRSQEFGSNSIITFHELRDGRVLIANTDGVTSWQPNTQEFKHITNNVSYQPWVMTIAQSKDHLLFGTMRNGMSVYELPDIKNLRQYTTDINSRERHIPANEITKILATFDGNFAISTYDRGVFFFDTESVDIPSLESPLSALNKSQIMDMEYDHDGVLWLAIGKLGLARYDNHLKTLELINLEKLGIPQSTNFSTIKVGNSEIWLGTQYEGFLKYDVDSGSTKRYTIAEGLPSNVIYAIEVDEDGFIWTSSSKGLSRLTPNTEEVLNFNSSHGLQGDDFNAGASLKLSDGTLLFGGNNGFNAFNPRDIQLNTHKGQTLVTSFSKMNEVQPGRFLSDGSETINLNHDENVFSFDYALMDFASPKDNTYEYQLVGFDQGWIDAGSRSTATYTNLDPGSYTFKVRGRNNDGLVTDKIASVNLVVSPPWWFTWHAYAAYLIVGMIAAWVSLRIYKNKVEHALTERRNAEEKQRLEQLVAQRTSELNDKMKELAKMLRQKEIANKEIHHRVKNNLQVILGLLTLQAESEENELFQEAMDEIRQRITSMSLIHKSLYENHVASIDFKQYTENLVGSIRQFHPDLATGHINILLDVDAEILDIDTALPAGLILNELITNAIKHGFKDLAPDALKLIRIIFKKFNGNYVLDVIDNGHGLPKEFDINSPSSMGSELSLIFAQQLGGALTCSTPTRGGACFNLTFPVRSKLTPELQLDEV